MANQGPEIRNGKWPMTLPAPFSIPDSEFLIPGFPFFYQSPRAGNQGTQARGLT
jgi:hypothetical protein